MGLLRIFQADDLAFASAFQTSPSISQESSRLARFLPDGFSSAGVPRLQPHPLLAIPFGLGIWGSCKVHLTSSKWVQSAFGGEIIRAVDYSRLTQLLSLIISFFGWESEIIEITKFMICSFTVALDFCSELHPLLPDCNFKTVSTGFG